MWELFYYNNLDLEKKLKENSSNKFNNTAAENYADLIEFTNDHLFKIEQSGKKVDLFQNFDSL